MNAGLAPTGTFRAGMNGNNATLANEAKATGIVRKALERAGAGDVRVVA
jgi:hypothetical protein